ncbi:hypothetical protein NPIL_665571 [Nephila pilipes]|uniref:Uncharacterized protein n=1 Tax=Nephila pilipes TaxID=299642 RepID=A0A8X6MMG9_NEPPI|nr:hypothetical protein NPIL_381961 [Nephila pilipes]GFU31226.1 hypothetical protein NPIL_665571 [Nephila pilipes]
MSISDRKVSQSLPPQREINSLRSLKWPHPSENYKHRSLKSFTVYLNAGLKAAEVWKCRSPSEITTLRGIGVACTLKRWAQMKLRPHRLRCFLLISICLRENLCPERFSQSIGTTTKIFTDGCTMHDVAPEGCPIDALHGY